MNLIDTVASNVGSRTMNKHSRYAVCLSRAGSVTPEVVFATNLVLHYTRETSLQYLQMHNKKCVDAED